MNSCVASGQSGVGALGAAPQSVGVGFGLGRLADVLVVLLQSVAVFGLRRRDLLPLVGAGAQRLALHLGFELGLRPGRVAPAGVFGGVLLRRLREIERPLLYTSPALLHTLS